MAKVDDEIEIRTVYRAVPEHDETSCHGCIALKIGTKNLCEMFNGPDGCEGVIWIKERSEVYSG